PRLLVPYFEFVAQPGEHHALVELREIAQPGGDEDATVAVDLDLGRMPEQHALEETGLLVLVGEPHQLALDVFPLGGGIEQQTAVAMDRQDQTAAAVLLQLPAIARRKRHAALGIEV